MLGIFLEERGRKVKNHIFKYKVAGTNSMTKMFYTKVACEIVNILTPNVDYVKWCHGSAEKTK